MLVEIEYNSSTKELIYYCFYDVKSYSVTISFVNIYRQQIKTLRYIHEKDVDTIKRLLESYKTRAPVSETKAISSDNVKPSTSADDDTIKLKPIGVISTWFPSKRGTPRQPGICGKLPGKLLLYNSIYTNPDHALEGLQDFSHMW